MFLGTHLTAFEGSVIPRATIEAYLATEYRVGGNLRFTLLIGQRHHGLDALLAGQKAGSAAVLTAWNPYSKPCTNADNERAQGKLVEELGCRGLDHFSGHGADPTGKWPAEDSRLVLGIDLAVAAELGSRFRQNGIVWAAGDALPMLVLLR